MFTFHTKVCYYLARGLRLIYTPPLSVTVKRRRSARSRISSQVQKTDGRAKQNKKHKSRLDEKIKPADFFYHNAQTTHKTRFRAKKKTPKPLISSGFGALKAGADNRT